MYTMRARDTGLLNSMRDRTVRSLLESCMRGQKNMHLLLRDERLEAASRLIFRVAACAAVTILRYDCLTKRNG